MLKIKAKKTEIDYKKFLGRKAQNSDARNFISDDTMLIDDEGNIVILYMKMGDDPFWETYREALQKINYNKTTRTSGLPTNDAIFGYTPKNAYRRRFCTAAAMAQKQPELHAVLIEGAVKISKIYEKYLPEVFLEHTQVAKENVLNKWVIKGTPFTSGIVNRNNELPYHLDRGNFKMVYSNMVAFKKDIGNGHLACPEYNLLFEISDKSLLMFDGQRILHGVTPIERKTPESERFTVVYYSLEGMWKCATTEKELAHAQKLKDERSNLWN